MTERCTFAGVKHPWLQHLIPGIERLAAGYHLGNYVLTRTDPPEKVWEVSPPSSRSAARTLRDCVLLLIDVSGCPSQSMPIYVRCGMQALYHGREQAKLLGMARVEELLKVRGLVQHQLETLLLFTQRVRAADRLFVYSSSPSEPEHQARHRIRLSHQRPRAHPSLHPDLPNRHLGPPRTRHYQIPHLQRVLLPPLETRRETACAPGRSGRGVERGGLQVDGFPNCGQGQGDLDQGECACSACRLGIRSPAQFRGRDVFIRTRAATGVAHSLHDAQGHNFTVPHLLGDEKLAKDFENGEIAVFRLAPADYHRYHSPIAGTVGKSTSIEGSYFVRVSLWHRYLGLCFWKLQELTAFAGTCLCMGLVGTHRLSTPSA